MDIESKEVENDNENDNSLYCGNHDLCMFDKCIVNEATNKYCMAYFCIYCHINIGDGVNKPYEYCNKTYCPNELQSLYM